MRVNGQTLTGWDVKTSVTQGIVDAAVLSPKLKLLKGVAPVGKLESCCDQVLARIGEGDPGVAFYVYPVTEDDPVQGNDIF